MSTTPSRKKKRKESRRLRISIAGRWYLALTLLLGVVSVGAKNNILYLLESFLLGGLILSGILSEWLVMKLSITWSRKSAAAGSPAQDSITLQNRSRLPAFCIEIGEWTDSGFKPRAFVPFLPSLSTVEITPDQPYVNRGWFSWKGIGISSSYPFGFARRVRILFDPNQRLIWPSQANNSQSHKSSSNSLQQGSGNPSASPQTGSGIERTEGELRTFQPEDDLREVVWTRSLASGEPLVRVRRSSHSSIEVLLNRRADTQEQFERAVEEAAGPLLSRWREQPNLADQSLLVIRGEKGEQRVQGLRPALDALALVEPILPHERPT